MATEKQSISKIYSQMLNWGAPKTFRNFIIDWQITALKTFFSLRVLRLSYNSNELSQFNGFNPPLLSRWWHSFKWKSAAQQIKIAGLAECQGYWPWTMPGKAFAVSKSVSAWNIMPWVNVSNLDFLKLLDCSHPNVWMLIWHQYW